MTDMYESGNSNNRIPPNDLVAESSILGAMMLDSNIHYDVISKLSKDDFYSPNNGEVFAAIEALISAGSPVDLITVCEELNKRNSLTRVGGRAAVAALSADIPSTANALSWAKIVEEKSTMRKLISTSTKVIEQAYSDSVSSETLLDTAEQQVFEISKGKRGNDVVPIGDLLLNVMDILGERAKNGGGLTGVPSGFLDLDKITGGFQKSDMIVLGARPSMGKTAFALCIARNAARKGKQVLIFSLEMSKEQLTERLMAMEANIDSAKIRSGKLESDDWRKLSATMDQLGKSGILIDNTPGMTLMDMKSKARKVQAESGLDLIVIDYLQLMEATGRTESRQQEISQLSRNVKQFAREMECPIIILSQLSRECEKRGDRRPQLADLRESGAIEQDADLIMFLYRDYYYNKETDSPGDCEVIIAKHRTGRTGTIHLLWQEAFTKFVNKNID